MKIQTKALHLSLTPAISDYVEKKIKSLEKYVDESVSEAEAGVEVSKTTNHHNEGSELFAAKVRIDAGETHVWTEEKDADLYAAIDKVRDELARQLSTTKKKKQHLLKRGGLKVKEMLRGFGWGKGGAATTPDIAEDISETPDDTK